MYYYRPSSVSVAGGGWALCTFARCLWRVFTLRNTIPHRSHLFSWRAHSVPARFRTWFKTMSVIVLKMFISHLNFYLWRSCWTFCKYKRFCRYILLITSRNPSNAKDWCQGFWRPVQFPAPKSPSENNYYLINSRFWHHLGVQISGHFLYFHVHEGN